MPQTLEERKEVIVTNDSRELMIDLRAKILFQNFPKIWVYLHNHSNNRFGIEIANEFGGPPSEDVMGPIQTFIEDYMIKAYKG